MHGFGPLRPGRIGHPCRSRPVEKREIQALIDLDFIVICCGGGGIPVIREARGFHGVEAVIDKDLASQCLAEEVGVDIFLVASDVDGVFLDYGRESQTLLRRLQVSQAAMHFACNTGKRAVICALWDIEQAVFGVSGTEVSHD